MAYRTDIGQTNISAVHHPAIIRARCVNETHPPYPYSSDYVSKHHSTGSLGPSAYSTGSFHHSGTGIPLSTNPSTSNVSLYSTYSLRPTGGPTALSSLTTGGSGSSGVGSLRYYSIVTPLYPNSTSDTGNASLTSTGSYYFTASLYYTYSLFPTGTSPLKYTTSGSGGPIYTSLNTTSSTPFLTGTGGTGGPFYTSSNATSTPTVRGTGGTSYGTSTPSVSITAGSTPSSTTASPY